MLRIIITYILELVKNGFRKYRKSRFKAITPNYLSYDEIDLFNKVNGYRLLKGLSPLILDVYHCELAEMRISQILKGDFNHDGLSMVRVLLMDKGINSASENLARHYFDSNSVINAWDNSPGHQATLVGDWKHTGISIRENYYCQIFSK